MIPCWKSVINEQLTLKFHKPCPIYTDPVVIIKIIETHGCCLGRVHSSCYQWGNGLAVEPMSRNSEGWGSIPLSRQPQVVAHQP